MKKHNNSKPYAKSTTKACFLLTFQVISAYPFRNVCNNSLQGKMQDFIHLSPSIEVIATPEFNYMDGYFLRCGVCISLFCLRHTLQVKVKQ